MGYYMRYFDTSEKRLTIGEIEGALRIVPSQVERLEQEIEELEFLISEIEDQIASEEVMKDPKALEKLAKDLQDAKEALNGKYEKWLQ